MATGGSLSTDSLVAPGQTERTVRPSWLVVAFLFVLTFINYGDRAALGVSAEPIMKDLDISTATFGLISSAFSFGYIPFNIIGGMLGDRFGPRTVLRTTAAVWSVALMAVSIVVSVPQLLASRIVFGAAEGPNFALDTKLVTAWTRPTSRARVLGAIMLGIPLGTALATPLLGLLASAAGWRWTFFVIGLVGLVWFAASLWLFRDRMAARAHRDERPDRETVDWASWRRILGNGSLWCAGVAYFCAGYLNYMAITWLPVYFQQQFGFSLKSSALASAIPWIGAAVGIVLGGLLSDAIAARGGGLRASRASIIGVGLLLAAGSLVVTATSDTLWMGILFMTLAMLFVYPTVTGVALAIPTQLLPHALVGRGTGVLMFVGSLAGIAGPYVTGRLISGDSGFSPAFLLAAAIAAAGGIVALVAIRQTRVE